MKYSGVLNCGISLINEIQRNIELWNIFKKLPHVKSHCYEILKAVYFGFSAYFVFTDE